MKHFTTILFLATLAYAQVSFERVRDGELEKGNWLTYSGNLEAHRFSPLTQIAPANVGKLRPAWIYQPQEAGRFETSPIVVGGVMYISEPPTAVTALDARTGRKLWRWERDLPAGLQTIGFGKVNRGVAVLDDKVFVATLDAHLVALDAKSGAVRWDVEVADYKLGYCLTAAPLVTHDAVLTGTAGGEAGIRLRQKHWKTFVALLHNSRRG
jgi:alcohol dehydrogenase (cytochrome c)